MIRHDDVIIQGDNIIKVEYKPVETFRPFNITLSELENQISEMIYYGANPKYGFNKVIDEKLEHAYLPQFVDSFYNYIYKEGKMPTQKEFWDYYLLSNSEYLIPFDDTIRINFMSTHFAVSRKAFIARILRAYPSLLRDFHFIIMLKDNDFFHDKYHYSLQDDYNKVDISITYNNKKYRFGLDVNTRRCNMFRELKQNRHESQAVHYLSINLSEGKRIGKSSYDNEKFIVYPESVLDEIKNMLAA